MSDEIGRISKKKPGPPPGTKIGGRAPGTPNKATETVRQHVARALGEDIVDFMVGLSKANPSLKFEVAKALLPHCLPKLRMVELSGQVETPASEETKEIAKFLAEMRSENLNGF